MPSSAGLRGWLPRYGLAGKLSLSLVVAGSLSFFLFGYMHQRLERRHLESLITLSAIRTADVIYLSTLQAMQSNDRPRLYQMIQDMAREPGVRRLRIINEEGQIQHSTDNREVGMLINKSAEACYACHAQSQPLSRLARKDRARIFRDEHGHRTLAVIRPIENSPDCSNAACHAHPESRRILGVIDAHLSLDAVDAQLSEYRAQTSTFTVGAAGIACVLSMLFVMFVVHRPVKELTHATGLLASGDLGYRIQVHSHDELGQLGTAFNSMAERLQGAQEELRQWGLTLEQRVQEKTQELERAHHGLLVNEKMASLGRLAATVAHEVNNPLFGMLTYARLTMKDVDRSSMEPELRARVLEHLRIIERESRRCGDLMKNLLAFSRQKPPQREPVGLNSVVEHAVSLVTHQYQLAQIALVQDLCPTLPDVVADPAQIQQVLIVFLVNAAEALGQGGTVTVTTMPNPEGKGVVFSVRDSGPGVPLDIQEKIFEPFYTTKDNQHRTGLGLAVARGIIERHGGELQLISEPGRGAEFRVALPLEAPSELAAPLKGESR